MATRRARKVECHDCGTEPPVPNGMRVGEVRAKMARYGWEVNVPIGYTEGPLRDATPPNRSNPRCRVDFCPGCWTKRSTLDLEQYKAAMNRGIAARQA